MDSKDRAILQHVLSPRTLQWNPRISYAEIARATGLDEETVRTRIKGWEEAGLMQGWELNIHPGLLDRELFRIEVPGVRRDEKEELLDRLALLDGARHGFDHFQGGIAAIFLAPAGPRQQRLLALVEELAGSPVRAWSNELPTCGHDPTELDWRIIQALREQPRSPYHELGEAVGVSTRTIRRRMDRLLEARALILTMDVDITAFSGVLSAELRAFHPDGPPREAVVDRLSKLEDRVFAAFNPEVSMVALLRENVAPLVELQEELEAMEGVREVVLDIVHRRLTWDRWLDEAIETQIAKAGGS